MIEASKTRKNLHFFKKNNVLGFEKLSDMDPVEISLNVHVYEYTSVKNCRF